MKQPYSHMSTKRGPPIGVGWIIQGWCGLYRGGVCHGGVGCGGSCMNGVGHGRVGWGGVCHGGVGWVMEEWGGVCHGGVGGVGCVM